MANAAKALLAGATVAFLAAVLSSAFDIRILGTLPEAYSRASSNLALLAIGVSLAFRGESSG